jgi:hypothetical protein
MRIELWTTRKDRVLLLLDDDDELPALPEDGESNLAAQLGPDALRAIDTAIVDHTRLRWLKVARIVYDAIRTGNFPVEDAIVELHVRRVILLVQPNVLEGKGNLRKPRWSEIRLAPGGSADPPR